MSSSPQPWGDRPTLSLVTEETIVDRGGLTPRSTLSDLFERWFLPLVLEPEGVDDATVRSYRESLAWWELLTGRPPLVDVDSFTVAMFRTGLKEATYRRGRRGQPRPLAPRTVLKHERQVATVLYRAGAGDEDRPGADLIRPPKLKVSRVKRTNPKPRFPLDDVRLLLAAAPKMPLGKRRQRWEVPPGYWWVAFLAVLFYTGLRTGTVRRLTWGMLRLDPTGDEFGFPGTWLKIPGSITKTREPINKFLHPEALLTINRIRQRLEKTPDSLILPWPHCDRHLIARHEAVQRLAGLPESRWLSPHAWRRTHAGEMFRLGADFARDVAQRTLDHANSRTTREFYVDGEAELIARLPSILPELGDRQLELF